MSRAFAPPDTLSPDDTRTIADVRRAVWINGLFGMGAGAATGTLGHIALQRLQRKYVGEAAGSNSEAAQAARTAARKTTDTGSLMYKCLRPLPPLGKNTFLLSLLGGGALGSFVMSTTAGKNAVHLLHPIFEMGRDEHSGMSPYQVSMAKAAKHEQGNIETTTKALGTVADDELDAAHHRMRSLRRKASMKYRLETGHSLSDTHSNTWPYNETEETEEMKKDKATHRAEAWERRQTQRREVVRDRIKRGAALSDATGGRWSLGESGER